MVGALDEGARGPFLVLGTTAPTDRRGIIAGGIEMQASVVSLEEPGEDGDADQRGINRENMKVPRWAGAPPRNKKKDEQPAR